MLQFHEQTVLNQVIKVFASNRLPGYPPQKRCVSIQIAKIVVCVRQECSRLGLCSKRCRRSKYGQTILRVERIEECSWNRIEVQISLMMAWMEMERW